MFATSVLITGANRGVGFELLCKLVGKTNIMFATCRSPQEATELQNMAKQHANITVLELDVTREDTISAAVNVIAETVGEKGLNCLINNAGQITRGSLAESTADDLRRLYEVNVIGPAMVAKECLPLLRKAACSGEDMCVSRAAVLNISSIMGSIASTSSSGHLPYRMSKAALNMFTKSLSIELKSDGILVASIHPGWVQTDMGGPRAAVTVDESASSIIDLVSTFTEKHNGGLYGWNGENIPW